MTVRATPPRAALILGATAVSGVAGYVVTWLVAAAVEPAEYTWFATTWSVLFLAVGALAGVQQEVTRASGPHPVGSGAALAPFVLVVAVVSTVILGATVPLWAGLVGGDATVVVALVTGCAAYCIVAGTSGALYGARAWSAIAALIAVDGVLRLGLVAVALLSGGPSTRFLIACAIVAPFPLALLVVLPFARRLLRGIRADVPFGRLAGNAAAAVLAAAASAVLISGFPALVAASADGFAPDALAPVLLALTITRAPIVIPAMALQSLLVVRFRESGARRAVLLVVGAVAAGALALAVLGALVGPPALLAAFGPGYAVDAGVVFVLVASSGFIAAIVVAGAGLLAAARHRVYVGGWIVAAAVTAAVLLVPGDAVGRILIAAVAGPLAALLVDVVALLVPRAGAPR